MGPALPCSNQRAASSSAFPLLASPGLAGWRAGPAGPCPAARGGPCCSALRLGWGHGLGITRGGCGGAGAGLVDWVGLLAGKGREGVYG
jgi:hypothetical protein